MPTQLTLSLPYVSGCISWKGLVIQLCLPILSFQIMILTPPKMQQQPWSLCVDKKQRILLRSNQNLQVQITEAAGERTRVTCGSAPLFLTPPFPVGNATRRKYRPIWMQAIFLLVPHVDKRPSKRTSGLLGQRTVSKALSVLPRGELCWAERRNRSAEATGSKSVLVKNRSF